MNWLMCKQDMHDHISYMTNDLSYPDDMSYKEFCEYIRPHVIYKWEEFMKELNCFKAILIEIPAGTWEVKEDKRTYEDFTKAELYKLNDNTKKETPIEKTMDSKVNKAKEFLHRQGNSKRQF